MFGAWCFAQLEIMAKKMLIDATHAEETRVVVVDGNKVEEFDFESENKRQLAGNIYLAKVTRVEPSLQAAFVDYGGNRHGFLAFSEIHPDYYQIPVADRKALMEEEAALAAAEDDEDKPKRSRSKSSRSRSRSKKQETAAEAATTEPDQPQASAETAETPSGSEAVAAVAPVIGGMETIDLGDDSIDDRLVTDVVETAETLDPVPESDLSEPVSAVVEEVATETVENSADEDDAADEGEKPKRPMAATSSSDDPVLTSDTIESADAAQDGDAPVVEDASTDAPAEDAPSDEIAEPVEAVADTAVAKETSVDGAAKEDKPTRSKSRSKSKAKKDATDRDETIESVADDDTEEEIRPARKSRARRYKIQEVVKVRQIMLVQVVKEERGNKGAALTTYLSLAGRYCVLMPNTARGGGISRKITNAADRSKLKAIASEIDVPKGAGLIVRTAGAKRTKTEIKRDYEYLQRLWEQIRELTLKSVAPAKIYEEGDLIKRSIRDLYSREIDEVLVEGEHGYRVAKDFMKMIMPSHAKNVQNYQDQLPLFARYQVETYLGGMFNPVVQLKSGGYIVIGVTEALVAVDVNSGRATKEGSIEETALKTNLEAAEEVARQLRLRDLAGLIVIDFIDMDERKNNTAVEKRLKDKLKTDRARIQMGRISGFGLLEMSRQRLRPGMIEATTQPCPHCHGTGLIRSDDNMALQVLRQIEEEGTRRRTREVLVKVPVSIANYLINQKREHIAQIEGRYGMSVRIEADPHLVTPDFSIEKFKTATRVVPAATAPVVSVDTSIMEAIDEAAEIEADVEDQVIDGSAEEVSSEDEQPKKKRRRRRRKSKSKAADANAETAGETPVEDASQVVDEGKAKVEGLEAAASQEAAQVDGDASVETAEVKAEGDAAPAEGVSEAEEEPKKRTRTRKPRAKSSKAKTEETASDEAKGAEPKPEALAAPVADATPPAEEPVASAPVDEKPKRTRKKASDVIAGVMATAEADPVLQEPVTEVKATAAPAPVADSASAEAPKPKRRGWWSIG